MLEVGSLAGMVIGADHSTAYGFLCCNAKELH
jgi:hypothetical protein